MAKTTETYGYGYGYGDYASTMRTRRRVALAIPFVFLTGFVAVYILSALNIIEFSTSITFGMVIAGIVYFLTLHDLRIGLALMLISIGISPEIVIGGLHNLRIEDFIVPAIFFAWITKVVRDKGKFEPTNLKMPIILTIVLMIISSARAVIWSNLELQKSLTVFLKICEYYLIFVIVMNTLKNKRELKTFITLLLLCSALTAIYSTIKHVTDPTFAQAIVTKRIMGPTGETANILGGYFIFHMLIAAGLLFQPGAKHYKKWLVVYILIMLYPMIHTLSRTSYVAFFGGLVLLGILKDRKILVFALVLFLLIPMLVDPPVIFRMKTITQVISDSPPPSWQARLDGWNMMLERLPNSPLIGFGIGSTTLAIDSEYVRVASDIGLIGLLLFAWMLVRMFKISYRTSAGAKDPVLGGYALGFMGGLLALVIHSIAATTFTTIRTMEPFFFATGILYIIHNRYSGTEEKVAPEPEGVTYEVDDVFVFAEDGLDLDEEPGGGL